VAPVVNLTDVEIREFEPLPNGEYRVAVDQAEVRQAASSGHDNVLFVLKVTDVNRVREQVDDIPALVGRTVPHGCSLQPQALWNLYRTLVALGTDPEELTGELDVNDEMLNAYLGNECVVTLRKRTYEGQENNQVVNIRALTEEEAAQLK